MNLANAHTDRLKRKFSASFLAIVLALSLGVQAFHFISHARHYTDSPDYSKVSITTHELMTQCVVCAQIFHQGQSALPAPAIEMTPPAPAFILQQADYTVAVFDRAFRNIVNKGPPSVQVA